MSVEASKQIKYGLIFGGAFSTADYWVIGLALVLVGLARRAEDIKP